MKKKLLFIIAIVMTLCYVPTVFALDVKCSGLGNAIIDAKIPNTVSIIILLIQIAVPIVLVIFGMIDLFKGITAGKEDEIKKAQQMFIKRLISAALVFFVVAIVKTVIGLAAGDDKEDILSCACYFFNGVDSNGECK